MSQNAPLPSVLAGLIRQYRRGTKAPRVWFWYVDSKGVLSLYSTSQQESGLAPLKLVASGNPATLGILAPLKPGDAGFVTAGRADRPWVSQAFRYGVYGYVHVAPSAEGGAIVSAKDSKPVGDAIARSILGYFIG